MAESIYKEDYNKEYLYQIVDNLNILYVATTRAKSNLIMFSDNTSNKANKISDLLNKVIPDLIIDGGTYDKEQQLFCYGEIVPSKESTGQTEEKADNPFEEKPRVENLPFSYFDSRIEFRQSRELARFLSTNKKEQQQQDILAQVQLQRQTQPDDVIETEKVE
jgi:ATP-dependent exoDNAse (exonuclease V) beta subunit